MALQCHTSPPGKVESVRAGLSAHVPRTKAERVRERDAGHLLPPRHVQALWTMRVPLHQRLQQTQSGQTWLAAWTFDSQPLAKFTFPPALEIDSVPSAPDCRGCSAWGSSGFQVRTARM